MVTGTCTGYLTIKYFKPPFFRGHFLQNLSTTLRSIDTRQDKVSLKGYREYNPPNSESNSNTRAQHNPKQQHKTASVHFNGNDNDTDNIHNPLYHA
jgi:hypothetical protein